MRIKNENVIIYKPLLFDKAKSIKTKYKHSFFNYCSVLIELLTLKHIACGAQ
jgi:hypothetical protein